MMIPKWENLKKEPRGFRSVVSLGDGSTTWQLIRRLMVLSAREQDTLSNFNAFGIL